MQKILELAALGLALSLGVAQAAEQKTPSATAGQQSRMKGCNAEAKTKALKGDERKAFMSECLKKKS